MTDEEQLLVNDLCMANKLSNDSWLIKDGSLQYNPRFSNIDQAQWNNMRKNYQHVVGVSKNVGTERNNVPERIIIFVDEQNKYVLNDTPNSSLILHHRLNITDRGRSLGIILFSVEQFRSAIHDRVKVNCATSVYGRTNAIEVSKSDYQHIPKACQSMMRRFSVGKYAI